MKMKLLVRFRPNRWSSEQVMGWGPRASLQYLYKEGVFGRSEIVLKPCPMHQLVFNTARMCVDACGSRTLCVCRREATPCEWKL